MTTTWDLTSSIPGPEDAAASDEYEGPKRYGESEVGDDGSKVSGQRKSKASIMLKPSGSKPSVG